MLSPPVITGAGPQNTFRNLYQDIVLRCAVNGNPQPTIAWYKDGRRISREGSPLLVIEEVELSDRGVYYCTAMNMLGTSSSDPAIININGTSSIAPYQYCIMLLIFFHHADVRQYVCVYRVTGVQGTDNFVEMVCWHKYSRMYVSFKLPCSLL